MRFYRVCYVALVLVLIISGCAETKKNVYVFGYVEKFNPDEGANTHNINYLGASAEVQRGPWRVEGGGGTYIDSFKKRSYIGFANFSHDDYSTEWFRPMLSLTCSYKGVSVLTDEMQMYCGPPVKLKIGKDTGPFVLLTPIPPLSDLTEGFVTAEFGFRF